MAKDPGPLSQLGRDNKQRLEAWRRESRANLGSYKDFKIASTGPNLTILSKDQTYNVVLNLATQAYKLDEALPRNLNMLASMVRDPSLSIEWRAKILEVMILRGAINEATYPQVLLQNGTLAELSKTHEERMQYQLAARDAVLYGSPGLFDHLSRSRDQLPDNESGRYPATEWMNTMLREGGLLSDYKQRQEAFEPWLNSLPAETRGQAMFHLRDAEGAREVGKVGTITGFEFSAGNSAASIGFGLQWENAKDMHWQLVGQDALGKVSDHLEKNPQEAREFYEGYRRADRVLPDLPPLK